MAGAKQIVDIGKTINTQANQTLKDKGLFTNSDYMIKVRRFVYDENYNYI